MPKIYFATNRKPNRVSNPDDFGSEFSSDGLANLRFGRAEVTGTAFDQIQIEVARENLSAVRPVLGSQAIFREAQQQAIEGKLDTVIFIHGFNVSFKDGLKAAAELERELTRTNSADKGAPLKLNIVVFSWPSDASLLLSSESNAQTAISYKNDRMDASASGIAFARAFLKLVDYLNAVANEQRCEQRLHLVAHSMGTYVLRHAVQEIRKQVGDRLPRLFDQVLLMAGDEDDDSFEFDYKLMYLSRLTRRTSVYFNRNDIALWASDTFKGNPSRLGTDGPLHPRDLPRNVYPIDCTQVVAESPKGSKEHGYYVNVPRVVTDLRRVLRGQIPDEILGRKFIFETNRYRLLPDANAPQQR